MQSGDNLILCVMVIGLAVLLANRLFNTSGGNKKGTNSGSSFTKWLLNTSDSKEKIKGKMAEYLTEQGYECIAHKCKVPMFIDVENASYPSRLYTDFLVKKNGKLYVVIIERTRKNFRYNGSSLRDFFLLHYLFYKPAGILYINPQDYSIKHIEVDIDNFKTKKQSQLRFQNFNLLLIGCIMGFILAGIIYKGQ